MAIPTVKMDTILEMVLSTGNREQNQHYPASIFNNHFNLVSSALVDEVARLFPTSQPIIDIIKPFLVTKIVNVKNGFAQLPENQRHLLNIGMYTDSEYKCAKNCEDAKFVYKDDPTAPSEAQIKRELLSKQCVSVDVKIVQIAEWNKLTTHKYKKPTYKKPIACLFVGEGLKVCPFDIPNVEIRYIRQPKTYKYNYTVMPDDTYVFNPSSSEDSEWQDNATAYLYKGISTLYAAYVKDPELASNTDELKKAGFF